MCPRARLHRAQRHLARCRLTGPRLLVLITVVASRLNRVGRHGSRRRVRHSVAFVGGTSNGGFDAAVALGVSRTVARLSGLDRRALMTASRLLGPAAFIRADAASIVTSASRAPSIHNTQPWRWTFDGENLDLRADRSRQLHVADRDGHSLLVSCGAAAELAALALRAHGWSIDDATMPDASDPDLLSRFTVLGRCATDREAGIRLTAAWQRRSERRTFAIQPVAEPVIDRLRDAAASAGVYAHFPSRPDEMLDLAVVVSAADRSGRDDPAYAAEMASWRRGHASDGISDAAIPEVLVGHPRHTDVPLRDFEAGVPGGQLIAADVDERPLIAVIFTDSDRAADRLLAGRSMMRLMIQAELDGLATCPLSQSVDLLSFRTRLRTLMSWPDHPQMMVRLGTRPAGRPAPPTSRRSTDEILTTV